MSSSRFKEIREQLGLTQEELSEVLGLSGKKAVSNIETGNRNPSTLAIAVMEILNELPRKESLKLMQRLKKYVAKSNKGAR